MLGHWHTLLSKVRILLLLLILREAVEAELVPICLLSLVSGRLRTTSLVRTVLLCVRVVMHWGNWGLLASRLIEQTFFVA